MSYINIKNHRASAIKIVTALDADIGTQLDGMVSDYLIHHTPRLLDGRKLCTLLTSDPRLNVKAEEGEIVFAFMFFETDLDGSNTQVQDAWVVNITHRAIVPGQFLPTKH